MAPAPYGVTPTGFNPMSEAEILAAIEADQRADLSQTLDLSDASLLGQLNRIAARRLADGWAAAKAVHDGNDPDLVRDDQAISLAKITGTDARGASRSQVDVTSVLTKGTKLVADQHFAHVTGKPDSRWTPVEDFTAPNDGSFPLRFRAEQPGPIDTPVGSIAVIVTPLVGWAGIVGSGEVSIGRNADDDADLHVRREQGLARAGSSTMEGIRADLLALDAAVSVQVFENFTDATDALGLPPKSFEAIVDAVDATDDQIAQAIWDSKPGGIQPIGSSAGTAFDKAGKPQVMRFSRPEQLEVWITYELVQLDGYVGDEAFKATIATRLDAELQSGASVGEWEVVTAAHGLGVKLRAAAFGLAPAPTTKTEIEIGTKQIARFDAGRIVLT